MTSAYHLLNHHELELEAARIARGYLPAISDVRYLELRAMAPHAEVDSLMSKLDELDDVRPTLSTAWMSTTPTILVGLAKELEAHERPDVAKRVLLRSLDWQGTHPPWARRMRSRALIRVKHCSCWAASMRQIQLCQA